MSDPNGWPDPSRPGVPLNPEVDGWHWLMWPHEDRALCVEYLAAKPDKWPLTPTWRMDNPNIVDRFRYLGPCLTPQEVAARVAEARNKALEEAAAVASKGEADTKEVSENPAYDADTRRTFYTMGRACKEIAGAIRALKGAPHD